MVSISADAGGVAEDLKRIDAGLKVRFAESGNPPFWAVYHESDDGRTTELVLTAQAHQTPSGVWAGLDGRIVDRVREIDAQGRSGYDFAAELQKHNQAVTKGARSRFHEKVGEAAGPLAHALRKDLGIKTRAFISKEVS